MVERISQESTKVPAIAAESTITRAENEAQQRLKRPNEADQTQGKVVDEKNRKKENSSRDAKQKPTAPDHEPPDENASGSGLFVDCSA